MFVVCLEFHYLLLELHNNLQIILTLDIRCLNIPYILILNAPSTAGVLKSIQSFLIKQGTWGNTRYHQRFCIASKWVLQDSCELRVSIRNKASFLWLVTEDLDAVPQSKKGFVDVFALELAGLADWDCGWPSFTTS